MFSRFSDKEWEKFGRQDPYYGVLSHTKFHKDKIDDDSLREFFNSGQDHINFVLQTIRTCLNSGFYPSRSLDFGCGVGRCAIPLAHVSQSVVGADVSNSMLEEARKKCAEESITNLELVKTDDSLSGVSGAFDLVHSFLVFQHIPRSRGERIFDRLVALLSDEGIAAVHFLYHREDSSVVRIMGTLRKRVPLWHNIVNLSYGKPFLEPLMEKNIYDLNRLLLILHRHRCGNIHLRFRKEGKLRSVVLFFQKKQDKIPYESYGVY